jgi:GNAT superfamily N-acetyltransferase
MDCVTRLIRISEHHGYIMSEVTFRTAGKSDLSAIITLLADDKLGANRESVEGNLQAYEQAFSKIDADPNNMVFVAEDEGTIIGCLQVTYIANLSFEGGTRALVEAVRVADSHQGQGLGKRLMNHAIDLARERGCKIVQLTSNKERPDAIRFYEQLGFQPTHIGFKLYL